MPKVIIENLIDLNNDGEDIYGEIIQIAGKEFEIMNEWDDKDATEFHKRILYFKLEDDPNKKQMKFYDIICHLFETIKKREFQNELMDDHKKRKHD